VALFPGSVFGRWLGMAHGLDLRDAADARPQPLRMPKYKSLRHLFRHFMPRSAGAIISPTHACGQLDVVKRVNWSARPGASWRLRSTISPD